MPNVPIPVRTPEMKARRSAQLHARTPDDLERLLRQFSPQHHAGIIERLRPHLTFEPGPIGPPIELEPGK